MEHTIELPFGYTDKAGVEHREVVFGKRLTVGDMIVLDNDKRAQNPVRYNDMVKMKAITKFGSLKLPITLDVLLSLNSVDREELEAAFETFLESTRDGREAEFADEKNVRLYFGLTIDDTVYERVEMGKLNTGHDEVEASAKSLIGIARECFLLGRRITKLSTEDGTASLEGPIALDKFMELDAQDLILIQKCGLMAATFSRIERSRAAETRSDESCGGPVAGASGSGKRRSRNAAKPDSELPKDSQGAKSAE